MSILIVGGKGNMGSRYARNLWHLDKEVLIADVDTKPKEIEKMADRASGIIIATPTDTHSAFILSLSRHKKPILCEKPLCKDVKELKHTLFEARSNGCKVSMVFQYGILAKPGATGLSSYDYFKHGGDGLAWDCIQIIGLARRGVTLAENSDVWRCMINGHSLNIADMDLAYRKFVEGWLLKPDQDMGALVALHEKTHEIDLEHRKQSGQYH